jgi:hypothetical protein
MHEKSAQLDSLTLKAEEAAAAAEAACRKRNDALRSLLRTQEEQESRKRAHEKREADARATLAAAEDNVKRGAAELSQLEAEAAAVECLVEAERAGLSAVETTLADARRRFQAVVDAKKEAEQELAEAIVASDAATAKLGRIGELKQQLQRKEKEAASKLASRASATAGDSVAGLQDKLEKAHVDLYAAQLRAHIFASIHKKQAAAIADLRQMQSTLRLLANGRAGAAEAEGEGASPSLVSAVNKMLADLDEAAKGTDGSSGGLVQSVDEARKALLQLSDAATSLAEAGGAAGAAIEAVVLQLTGAGSSKKVIAAANDTDAAIAALQKAAQTFQQRAAAASSVLSACAADAAAAAAFDKADDAKTVARIVRNKAEVSDALVDCIAACLFTSH